MAAQLLIRFRLLVSADRLADRRAFLDTPAASASHNNIGGQPIYTAFLSLLKS
jgi:hypothetical protein